MVVDKPALATCAKLSSIQYLRAIAALLVVFHHAHNDTPWLYNPFARYGADARGVDIFFVISGFVMYAAARTESVSSFIRKRLIRIVPLYWFVTIAFIALSGQFTGPTLICSLLFIPIYSPYYIGEVWPILIPGWTLNFEMFFYAVFAVALTSRRVLVALIAVIVPLVIAGALYPATNAIWRTYTSPMLLEFLGGALIALAYQQTRHRRTWWRWVAGLFPFAVVALLVSDLIALPLIVKVGIPAMMIVAGAISFEVLGKIPDLPVLGLIGDASYAIYLTHIIVIGFCGIAIQASGLAGLSQFLTMMALSMLASTIIGIAVHQRIEKPIQRLLARYRLSRTEACRAAAYPA